MDDRDSQHKGNPLTYQETEEMFRELEKESRTGHPGKAAVYEKQLASYDVCKTSERNRSRMEYRTMQSCHNTDLITLCKNQREIGKPGAGPTEMRDQFSDDETTL